MFFVRRKLNKHFESDVPDLQRPSSGIQTTGDLMSPRRAPPRQPPKKSGSQSNKVLVYIIIALVLALGAILLPIYTELDSDQSLMGISLVLGILLLVEVLTMPKAPTGRAAPAPRERGRSPPKGKGAGKPRPRPKPAAPRAKPGKPVSRKGPAKPKAKKAPSKPAAPKKPKSVVVVDEETHEVEIDETPPVPEKPRSSAADIKKEIESRRMIYYPSVVSGGKYGDCFLVVDKNTVLTVRTLLARSCRMCKNRDACWEKYQDVMDYDTFMDNLECLEEGTDVIPDDEEKAAVVEEVTLADDTQIVEDYATDETFEEDYVEEDVEDNEEDYVEEEGEEEVDEEYDDVESDEEVSEIEDEEFEEGWEEGDESEEGWEEEEEEWE